MTDYTPPVTDMMFVIRDVLGLDAIAALPGYEEAAPDLVGAILEEAARYFGGVIAPTNQPADIEGCRVENGAVVTPPSLNGLYDGFRDAGWPALTGDVDYGGQGFPQLVGIAVDEMFQSANLGFSLLPLLTMGVTTALEKFGDARQKALYLPRLISGEWSGTMNLTEAQAGSDLAAVRTRAVPEDDHYLISGQKIFISWGDHALADNIVHLVLAKTPDAPEGVKGISLFIVPKFLHDENGNIGAHNDVLPVSVEHKMGIHASPTCVLSYGENGGAVGYLVGRENEGLTYMFAMMNHARLAVGLQGVSVGERAYQQAVTFAKEREQGSMPGVEGRATIIHYPDVRRMLMLMRSLTEAGRLLCYAAMGHWDRASRSESAADRDYHQRRVDILTPLVKGWCTEAGNEVTYWGVQIHGGMGFIEETGVAQYMRDARITPIYEGTNGIQAMDLVGRKLLRDRGAAAQELLNELRETLPKPAGSALNDMTALVARSIDACEEAINLVLTRSGSSPDFAGAVAFNTLLLMGTTTAAALLLKSADIACQQLASATNNRSFLNAKITTARFFAEQVLPRTDTYLQVIRSGDTATMALAEDDF